MSGASQTGSILAFVLSFLLLTPPPSPQTTVRNKPIGWLLWVSLLQFRVMSLLERASRSRLTPAWRLPGEPSTGGIPIVTLPDSRGWSLTFKESSVGSERSSVRLRPSFPGQSFWLPAEASLRPGQRGLEYLLWGQVQGQAGIDCLCWTNGPSTAPGK